MNEGQLSVIVLTYKHGDLLFDTLDSVLCQDYPNIQLIVAEDGAKDFDADKVERYIADHSSHNLHETLVIHSGENNGTVRNINKALEVASGEYIKLIAGDDTFSAKDVASKQIDFLKNNPDKYLVMGEIVECDANMVAIANPKQPSEQVLAGSRDEMLRYFCKKNSSFLATQSICFRRVFFEKYGVYDERFELIEDLPMAVRIIRENVPFGYQAYPCVNHRGSVGVSTSNNPFEVSKIPYYMDLLNYYDLVLNPVKDTIGKTYVDMRRSLIAFRIEYSQTNNDNSSKVSRIILIAKNIVPIGYYAFSQFGRFLNYIRR